MSMIDINKSTTPDEIFVEITKAEPSPERTSFIHMFVKSYWMLLSEDSRRVYTKTYGRASIPAAWNDMTVQEIESAERIYQDGMNRQELGDA